MLGQISLRRYNRQSERTVAQQNNRCAASSCSTKSGTEWSPRSSERRVEGSRLRAMFSCIICENAAQMFSRSNIEEKNGEGRTNWIRKKKPPSVFATNKNIEKYTSAETVTIMTHTVYAEKKNRSDSPISRSVIPLIPLRCAFLFGGIRKRRPNRLFSGAGNSRRREGVAHCVYLVLALAAGKKKKKKKSEWFKQWRVRGPFGWRYTLFDFYGCTFTSFRRFRRGAESNHLDSILAETEFLIPRIMCAYVGLAASGKRSESICSANSVCVT